MNLQQLIKMSLTLLLIVTLSGCANEVEQLAPSDPNVLINVPQGDGDPVLLDGIFSEGEWSDAKIYEISDSVKLYFKEYRGHFYLGVYTPSYKITVPNAYFLLSDSTILQLHVSAQLGERILIPNAPDEEDSEFKWGFAEGWYANENRWDENLIEELIDSLGLSRNESLDSAMYKREGTEIQIQRSILGSDSVKFMIEVSVMSPGYDGNDHFPNGAEKKRPDNWTTLVF